ncbi:MAG: YncE family protein [Bryobacterales bacterium]|nr:YncE family protein [Bryobacterales bacterium]
MKAIAFLLSALSAFALDFPMSLAVAPDGRVLALSGGAKASISVVNGSELPLPDAWLGLTFSPDGKNVYAGGGSRGVVYELAYAQGELKLAREMKASDFVGDVAVSPDGRLIYAADLFGNAVVVINPQSGRVIDKFKTGRRPYRILFHPDGRSYFVSSWADAAVYQHNVTNGEEIGRIRLGPHPTDMVLSAYKPEREAGEPPIPWRYRLFVAAANTNNVFVVGIGENKTLNLVESIHVAPSQLSPLGMTPSALALSADQTRLYVACSDAGVVASVDVSDVRGVVDGFIPTGAYPAALRTAGGKVWVANARANSVRPLGEVAPVPAEREPPKLNPAAHVIYVIRDSEPEAVMRAVAGIAPDFAVKLGRRPNFDFADPANLPPAGYLWTNALAAGLTVRNYGVMLRNGQAVDPAIRPFTKPDAAAFLEDLKQFEASGMLPRLIVIADPSGDAVKAAIAKSPFAGNTEIVVGDLRRAEALLGLRPMTRKD